VHSCDLRPRRGCTIFLHHYGICGRAVFKGPSRDDSPISENEIIIICSQICEVFQLLHSSEYPILYLDLKPGNIILKDLKVKVIDFGTARRGDGSRESVSMGTRGFAAPEESDAYSEASNIIKQSVLKQ
jgi:serine/threonine protein kinase